MNTIWAGCHMQGRGGLSAQRPKPSNRSPGPGGRMTSNMAEWRRHSQDRKKDKPRRVSPTVYSPARKVISRSNEDIAKRKQPPADWKNKDNDSRDDSAIGRPTSQPDLQSRKNGRCFSCNFSTEDVTNQGQQLTVPPAAFYKSPSAPNFHEATTTSQCISGESSHWDNTEQQLYWPITNEKHTQTDPVPRRKLNKLVVPNGHTTHGTSTTYIFKETSV